MIDGTEHGFPVSPSYRIRNERSLRFGKEPCQLSLAPHRILLVEFGEPTEFSLIQSAFRYVFDQVRTELQLGGRHPKELERATSPKELFPAVEEAAGVGEIGGDVQQDEDGFVSVPST